MLIELEMIKADTQAQPRVAMLTDEIAGYAERMAEGDAFPPLIVFQDGDDYWLADGFHRYYAAKSLELLSDLQALCRQCHALIHGR